MKILDIIKCSACAFALTAMTSCDDWLDNKPKGFTIPEKYNDYKQLMNGQGLYRALDVYPLFITDDAQLVARGTCPEAPEFEFYGMSEEIRNAYSFQHGQLFTPGQNDACWEDAYANIFTYNAVINNVLKASDGTVAEREQLWAEALVGRAFEYMNLVNLYGNHYDSQTAANDYGVPLVLSEEIKGEKYARASVEQVYQQIKSDLDKAVPKLAQKTKYSFDPSQSVGYAFLSRMYLYQGNYEKALENARLSLQQNDKLLDYKLYKAIQGQWGRLVLASDEGEAFPDEAKNIENVYTRLFNNTTYIFKQVAASNSLLETFARNLPANGEDMRLALFFSKDEFNPYTTGGSPVHFPGYTIFAPYIEINCGLSTPEVYLTAAECEARIGDPNKSLEYLNRLRDMRIKNNVHFNTPTNLSKEEVLKMVIDERRKEFAFNGLMRLIDLKRLNRESWFAKTITHSAGEEGTWTLEPNDLRYIMPVPENVLSFNDMPQYER